MDETALASLTIREREALLLLAQGYRVGEAAARLGVSRSTVETHLKSARRKLGLGSSLLAARTLYGEDPPPRKMGSGVSGMVIDAPVEEQGVSASIEMPAGKQPAEGDVTGRDDRHDDLLGRLFGRRDNRNGLTRPERLIAWLLLTALVGIGSFASLAIPYLVQALRRH